MNSVLIFAKYPEPGKVKTRLGAQIGYDVAAGFYRLFLEQTLALSAKLNAVDVFLAVEPEERIKDFLSLIPTENEVFPQCGENLGQRLISAFEHVFSKQAGKVIALGSDSPTLPGSYIMQAFESLDHHDVVLGPADDGGYYLIGIKKAREALFQDIDWSTNSVLKTTIRRVRKLGLNYSLLDSWYDVDALDSLRRAARDDASGKIQSYMRRCKIDDSNQ